MVSRCLLVVAGLALCNPIRADEPGKKYDVITPKNNGIVATGINGRGEIVGFEWVEDKKIAGILNEAPICAGEDDHVPAAAERLYGHVSRRRERRRRGCGSRRQTRAAECPRAAAESGLCLGREDGDARAGSSGRRCDLGRLRDHARWAADLRVVAGRQSHAGVCLGQDRHHLEGCGHADACSARLEHGRDQRRREASRVHRRHGRLPLDGRCQWQVVAPG